MNEEKAIKQLENILKNTENLLNPLDEEAPESVKKFQKMQFKNYNAIKIILNLLEKKDKIINLMSEYISSLDIDEDICMKNTVNTELCNEEYLNCKECIKQYFERKVENGN